MSLIGAIGGDTHRKLAIQKWFDRYQILAIIQIYINFGMIPP